MTRLRLTVLLLACALLGVTAATSAAAVWHLGDRTLRLGASGGDVRSLQRLLTRSGFTANADGTFGRGTRTAVSRFQRAATLRPTGVAGPGTIRLLKVSAGSAGATPPATDGGATFGTAPAPKPLPTSAPSPGPAATGAAAPQTGPAGTATLRADGTAAAPSGAPPPIVALIAAANRIATLPYRYGGGHGSFDDTAYDCSGSVSYALHGAQLLDRTMTSGDLEAYGSAGPGRWVTIHANAEHVYMYVAGLRFDTSGQRATGSRWQTAERSDDGFVVRHPTGY